MREKQGFSAAEFARMCGTTKRTLQYYEKLGIFQPASVGENGYRRYAHEQYDVFMVISALQKIGMSLGEIRSFLRGRTPGELVKVLERQLAALEEQQQRLARLRLTLEHRLELARQAEAVSCGQVDLSWCPQERLVLSRRVDSSEVEVYRSALYAHLEQCERGQLNEGYPFGAMLEAGRVLAGDSRTYAYFFTKVTQPPPDTPLFEKPAGMYARVYFQGDYRQADRACAQLAQEAERAGYALGPYFYKEGIVDEIAAARREDYVTGISVQLV